MPLSLRPAADAERLLCESMSRRNMSRYLAARNITWDPQRYLDSWAAFENLLILSGHDAVGVLRLVAEEDAMGLRELQVHPECQRRGIGTWAVRQAQAIAVSRGVGCLRLRVYEENPARTLYARLGFTVTAEIDSTVHMAWAVRTGAPGPAGESRAGSPRCASECGPHEGV